MATMMVSNVMERKTSVCMNVKALKLALRSAEREMSVCLCVLDHSETKDSG